MKALFAFRSRKQKAGQQATLAQALRERRGIGAGRRDWYTHSNIPTALTHSNPLLRHGVAAAMVWGVTVMSCWDDIYVCIHIYGYTLGLIVDAQAAWGMHKCRRR